MSQFSFGNINEDTTTGNLLASYLEQFEAAVQSGNAGSTAPTYAIQGMEWIDTSTSPALVKKYTGITWSVLGSLNLSTGAYIPYNSGVAMGAMSALGVGDGLESSGGNARIKLDGSSLSRSSAGLKVPSKGITTAMLADGTIGAVKTFDATGVAIDLAPGTAGQSLLSQGTGQPLIWGDSSGDCKLLATRTVGFERDIDFEGIFTNTYHSYRICFDIRGWDVRYVAMKLKRDGQASYDEAYHNYMNLSEGSFDGASSKTYVVLNNASSFTYQRVVVAGGSVIEGAGAILLPGIQYGDSEIYGEYTIINPRLSGKTMVKGSAQYFLYDSSSVGLANNVYAMHMFNEAVNSLRLMFIDSRNGGDAGARSGTVKIYGYK